MITTEIRREDLLHEISTLAYVIADVSEGKELPHTLHQTFDICEEGNIDRVDSLLALAAAEIGCAVGKGISFRQLRENYLLTFCSLPEKVAVKVTELAKEYMVASVLCGWLSVTLPAAAPFWKSRKDEVMSAICSAALTIAAFTRRQPPI